MAPDAQAGMPVIRSDTELIDLTRGGDIGAFGELWRRHSRAAISVARSYTTSFDPDDLVSESFAKIFHSIQNGGGPTLAFRPYLFTTVRNTAIAWARAKHDTSIGAIDEVPDPNFSEESRSASIDREFAIRAFRLLPTRWQQALWYSEVEGLPPQQIAPLLGIKPNAVAALNYRAREGLRQAWIRAHLSSVPDDAECHWVLEHLGAYVRHGLGKRELARVEKHLKPCEYCAQMLVEARSVGSELSMLTVAPIVAEAATAVRPPLGGDV
jgi:RNA polymerase sigma factor (sigma-70 family)